jgi:hypothetical protein
MERKIIVLNKTKAARTSQGPTDILVQQPLLSVEDLFAKARSDGNLKVVTQGGQAMKYFQDNLVNGQSATPRAIHDIGMKAHGP